MAGTLAEIAHHTLRGEFRHIDPAQARVILVEGTDRVLPPYSPKLSEKARRQLEHLGVVVSTGKLVTGVDATGVWLGEERIAARTVVWAAGVAASPLGRSLGVPVDRAGRVKVAPDLTVPGHKEVFVTGDLALVEEGGRPVPGVADFGRFQLWGGPAWLAWLGIHIFFLIGFRNRLVVMFDWAIAYFTYQRHARLLMGPLPPLRSAESEEARAEALTHSSH